MKTLKKGRETLLTLLEAFVYDPLVDWAVGEDTITTTSTNELNAVANASYKNRIYFAGAGSHVGNVNSGNNNSNTNKDRPGIVGGGGGSNTSYNATEAVFGNDMKQARKQLEHELTRDTLVMHFAEIKPDWLQNRSVDSIIIFKHVLFTREIECVRY